VDKLPEEIEIYILKGGSCFDLPRSGSGPPNLLEERPGT